MLLIHPLTTLCHSLGLETHYKVISLFLLAGKTYFPIIPPTFSVFSYCLHSDKDIFSYGISGKSLQFLFYSLRVTSPKKIYSR